MTVVPFKAPVANATGISEEGSDSAPNARSAPAGTRAHAGEAEWATPPAVVDLGKSSVVEETADLWSRALAFWTPPEIWSQPRPSLSQLTSYAWHGPWTGQDTHSRWMGRTYAAVVSIPAHALAYVVLWLVERPARLGAAALLGLLICLSLIV